MCMSVIASQIALFSACINYVTIITEDNRIEFKNIYKYMKTRKIMSMSSTVPSKMYKVTQGIISIYLV